MLVDNFNNASNNQGTGTTIVDVHPDGQLSVFASLPHAMPGCPGGVGLTTAMVQLKTGWVIVGSLPSTDGKIGTAGAGCLIELSPDGQAGRHHRRGRTWTGRGTRRSATTARPRRCSSPTPCIGITGRSSDATGQQGQRGTADPGRRARPRAPKVTAETDVASGLPERPDASAFVKGPTGAGARRQRDPVRRPTTWATESPPIPNALTRTNSAGTGAP